MWKDSSQQSCGIVCTFYITSPKLCPGQSPDRSALSRPSPGPAGRASEEPSPAICSQQPAPNVRLLLPNELRVRYTRSKKSQQQYHGIRSTRKRAPRTDRIGLAFLTPFIYFRPSGTTRIRVRAGLFFFFPVKSILAFAARTPFCSFGWPQQRRPMQGYSTLHGALLPQGTGSINTCSVPFGVSVQARAFYPF